MHVNICAQFVGNSSIVPIAKMREGLKGKSKQHQVSYKIVPLLSFCDVKQ
jgi:hypothetical protein